VTETVVGRLTLALSDRYAIERQVGQGGMATVYLARDLRHDRKVALKVLRPELAAVIGADRFLQEIRVTAGLQHPHILPLHDSGEADSFLFYVMPFVDGESLRNRLERERQLPIDDAIRIATEAAGALAYAHSRGVIHRDIKPENILIAHGSAVVADFGIARAVTEAGGGRLTETGLSLGTPQYMSPEQATADRELDGRSDVYALGAVLYEMLIGEPPYTGPTTQSVIAKLLTETPRPVLAGRPTVPAHVAAAVHKALARLPADRFRGAHEFADALARPGATLGGDTAPVPGAPIAQQPGLRRSHFVAVAGVAALAVAVAAWGFLRSTPAPTTPVVRSVLVLSGEARTNAFPIGTPLTLSPDGTTLVYAGGQQLFLRRLDQLHPVPLPNTQGAAQPFFSPDGLHVGFLADGSLKRVALAGGPAVTLAPVAGISGGSWGANDRIVYSAGGKLFLVPASGGTPTPVRVADTTVPYRWPDFLPDGRSVLVTIGLPPSFGTGVVNLETGQVSPIPGTGGGARLVEPGTLVSFGSDGSAMALPFDWKAGRATGAAVPALEGVAMTLQGAAKAALSRNGIVVYSQAGSSRRRLALVDRRGVARLVATDARPFSDPRFSPSGREVAITVIAPGGGLAGDIWVFDLQQSTLSRLTFEGRQQFPDWSPDGSRVVYTTLSGASGVFWSPAGGGEMELLYRPTGDQVFEGLLSHDQRSIVFRAGSIPGDLYYVRRDSLDAPHALLTSPHDERSPALSPDDRWLAYVSNETGRDEVYVRPFPGRGGRWLVSTAGGTEPTWRRDGRELFYRNGDSLFAVPVRTGPGFAAGGPTLLFVSNYLGNGRHATYDVHPDGRRFVFVTADPEDAGELILVQNFLSMVARRSDRSR